MDFYSLDNGLRAFLRDNQESVSPIELQIAYKLYLGSDKDVEDAIYLWEIFKENIDREKLNHFMKKMNLEGSEYGIG